MYRVCRTEHLWQILKSARSELEIYIFFFKEASPSAFAGNSLKRKISAHKLTSRYCSEWTKYEVILVSKLIKKINKFGKYTTNSCFLKLNLNVRHVCTPLLTPMYPVLLFIFYLFFSKNAILLQCHLDFKREQLQSKLQPS